MASLIQQMNELQKRQNILAEQIRQEEERQAKLNMKASIARLEELIKPITQELDWIPTNLPDNYFTLNPTHQTIRKKKNQKYENLRNQRILNNQNCPWHIQQSIPSKLNREWNIVGCEEIFVTLLGIIKKQEARINKLESQYLRNE